jgi:VWFA-related protein
MKKPALFLLTLLLVFLPSTPAQSPKNLSSAERKHKHPNTEIPASPPQIKPPTEVRPVERNNETSVDGKVRLGVDLVVLDAQVLQQRTGRIVGDLKKEDFKVFEDGVKQEITHFSQDTLPLSVILLLDRGGCLDPFGERMRKATLEALKRLRPQDEVALMTFARDVDLLHGFGADRNRIADAVLRVPDHDEEAPHCFSRAFYEAAKYMRRASNPDGRRVIIMITAITRSFDCSGPSVEQARLEVLESGSVVCGLIPKTPAQRLENGIISSLAAIAGAFKVRNSGLKELAEETGGEVLSDKPEVIDRAFNTLVEHLRTRYSIGYVSTNTNRDGGLRKLKLEIAPPRQSNDNRLVVKTRRGYIAPRAPEAKRATRQ